MPENQILRNLMTAVGKSLNLTGVDGVNTSSEFLDVIDRREPIAGIEFWHPAVNTLIFQYLFVRNACVQKSINLVFRE